MLKLKIFWIRRQNLLLLISLVYWFYVNHATKSEFQSKWIEISVNPIRISVVYCRHCIHSNINLTQNKLRNASHMSYKFVVSIPEIQRDRFIFVNLSSGWISLTLDTYFIWKRKISHLKQCYFCTYTLLVNNPTNKTILFHTLPSCPNYWDGIFILLCMKWVVSLYLVDNLS